MLNWLKKTSLSSGQAPQAIAEPVTPTGSAVQQNLITDSTAHKTLGDECFAQGKLAEAVASYEQALAIDPNYAEVYNNLGNVFREQGLPAEAERHLKQAILIKPALINAYYNLGSVLYMRGKLTEAIQIFNKTLEIKPNFIEAYNYLGIVYMALKNFTEAITCFQKALSLEPDFIDAYCNLGGCYQAQGKKIDALSCFRRANEIDPANSLAKMNMLHLLQHVCEWKNLEPNTCSVKRLIMQAPATIGDLSSPFTFLALPGTTIEEQKRYAEYYVQSKRQSLSDPVKKFKFEFNQHFPKKISIGYLSADFRQHPVAFLMAEIFELHDRDRFNVIAYSSGMDDHSTMRKRLESAFDNFVDIQNDPDEVVARKIYEDNIDILIDLTGHTQDSRSAILSLRPAPIQVNYLGYPGTMGADFVDFIIADRFTIPPEMQQHYTESVVWMPDCFQANDRTRPRLAPPSRKDCGLTESDFVFCCFNQTFKFTPDVFNIWCRLLNAVPGSVLWIAVSNSHTEGNLRREAVSRGVASERIIIAPLLPPNEHLARMQCADLFLDTLPYNAGTTCSDALWMGLPVITCAGDSFVSRMAGSLLTSIGVPELITYNLEDYYHLALDLATDSEKLKAIRNRIIASRDTSPLFDSARFTRNLESVYIQMIDSYLQETITFS